MTPIRTQFNRLVEAIEDAGFTITDEQYRASRDDPEFKAQFWIATDSHDDQTPTSLAEARVRDEPEPATETPDTIPPSDTDPPDYTTAADPDPDTNPITQYAPVASAIGDRRDADDLVIVLPARTADPLDFPCPECENTIRSPTGGNTWTCHEAYGGCGAMFRPTRAFRRVETDPETDSDSEDDR